MTPVLTTNGLTNRYGKFTALDGLTMTVPRGAIYGVDRRDKKITKYRRRMGAVVETPSIYLDMSAEDNLKQQYCILGLPAFNGIQDLLALVGLEGTGKKRARNFSLGMKHRLGIAVALAGDPVFLVLDEPINSQLVAAKSQPNSSYVPEGPVRVVLQFLYDFLPGGQTGQYATTEAARPAILIAFDGVIFAATAAGMVLFRWKDLSEGAVV